MKKTLLFLIFCLVITVGFSQTIFGCWPRPENVAFSVNRGANNETVQMTITGEKFSKNVEIKLVKPADTVTGTEEINAGNVNVLSQNQITCSLDLKDKAVGAWDLIIINKHKFLFFEIDKAFNVPGGFTIEYPTPTLSEVNPKQSLNNKKITMKLLGAHFRPGMSVVLTNRQMDIGATNLNITSENLLSCDFNLDNVAIGTYNVKVTNENGRTGILPDSFTVLNPSITAPAISEINPERGFNNGMALVTLTGANFDKNITVKLQGNNQLTIPGVNIKAQSSSKLTCYLDIAGKPEGKYDLTVINPDGQSANLKQAFTVETYTPVTELNNLLKPLFFDLNKANIRSDQVSRMDYNLSVLKDNEKYYILIGGHADERGSEEYNLELSSKRAEAVKKYLVDRGINPERITIYSYGKDNPAKEGRGETNWWVNRRVDILVWEAPPEKDQGIREWDNETEIP